MMLAKLDCSTDSYVPSAGSIVNALASDPVAPTQSNGRSLEHQDSSDLPSYRTTNPRFSSSDLGSTTVVALREYSERRNSNPTVLAKVVETSPRFSVRKSLRAQLAELGTAGSNWDGYGAKATNRLALKYAAYVIDKWIAPSAIIPEIALLSDGCISFELYDSEDDLIGALDVLGDVSAAYALSVNGTADVCSVISLKDPSGLNEFFTTLEKAIPERGQHRSD